MNLISLVGASKDFGLHCLFKDLTIHIKEKDRLGLIGPNGAGKSTLLKILAGKEPLEKGERRCSSNLKMEYVGQQSAIAPGRTVLEEVLAGCGNKRELLLRFHAISDEIAKSPNDIKLLSELGQISEKMDATNAWSLEQQCKEVLQRLGIKNLQTPIEELSGGFRKRVCLASALVANPDVLLLDEPTNHLDAIAVEWLQNWLKQYSGALVIITHDRYFLDQATSKMLEIEGGKSQVYKGNYSIYLQQKAEKDSLEESSISKFKGILRRELAWLRQGPKARSSKQKARILRIEKMQKKPSNTHKKTLEISQVSRRIGKIVIQIENIKVKLSGQKNYKLLINEFSYDFNPEDRVGIIGPNGCGKSTLLDLIAGRKQPTSGNIRLGDTVYLGYLDQHTETFFQDKGQNRKVIDFIEEVASEVIIGNSKISTSQLLERFLFSPSQQHSPLKKLSGGERRRLTLCRILAEAPNVLLLDEPTNDLDVQTLSVLEDFLEDFKGCVVIVSHDRYFLDRTVDRIFNFENCSLKQYEGNYSAFIQRTKLQEINSANNSNQLKSNSSKSSPNINNKTTLSQSKHKKKPLRRSFKQNQELAALDKQLPLIEIQVKALEKDLSQGNGDLTLLSKELAALTEQLKIAEDRWLELSEISP